MITSAISDIASGFNELAELLYKETQISIYDIGFSSYNHTHYGGKADCNNRAKCNLCGKEYGELVSHKLVLSNNKEANYDEDGYTGDQQCSLCGKIIEKGSIIPKPKRIAATGKFKLMKDYIQKQNSTVSGTGDKCIYTIKDHITDTNKKVSITSIISYSSKDAKFYFIELWKADSGESYYIKAELAENGSDKMIVICSDNTDNMNAIGEIYVPLYSDDYHISFKMSSFVEKRYSNRFI